MPGRVRAHDDQTDDRRGQHQGAQVGVERIREHACPAVPGRLRLLAVVPGDPERIVVSARTESVGERVLVSDDGGERYREYLALSELGGFVLAPDGRVFIGDAGLGLGPGDSQGLWTAESLSAAPYKIAGYPVRCLEHVAETDTLLGCQHFWFGRIDTRGGNFERTFSLTETQALVACDGEDVATMCEAQLCGAFCGRGAFAQAPACAAYEGPDCGPCAKSEPPLRCAEPVADAGVQIAPSEEVEPSAPMLADADGVEPSPQQATARGCAVGGPRHCSAGRALLLLLAALLSRRWPRRLLGFSQPTAQDSSAPPRESDAHGGPARRGPGRRTMDSQVNRAATRSGLLRWHVTVILLVWLGNGCAGAGAGPSDMSQGAPTLPTAPGTPATPDMTAGTPAMAAIDPTGTGTGAAGAGADPIDAMMTGGAPALPPGMAEQMGIMMMGTDLGGDGDPTQSCDGFYIDEGHFTLPPGGDVNYCVRVAIPPEWRDSDLILRGWNWDLGDTHHYFMEHSPNPFTSETPMPCNPDGTQGKFSLLGSANAEGSTIAFGAGSGQGFAMMREGYGKWLPKGGHWRTSHHVINFTEQPIDVTARFKVCMEKAEGFPHPLNTLVCTTTAINTPGTHGYARATCMATEDIEIHLLASHGHQHMSRFTVQFYDGQETRPEIVMESNDWDSAGITTLEQPLKLAPGQGLTYTCHYEGTGPARFVDNADTPEGEHCAVFTAYSYPEHVLYEVPPRVYALSVLGTDVGNGEVVSPPIYVAPSVPGSPI